MLRLILHPAFPSAHLKISPGHLRQAATLYYATNLTATSGNNGVALRKKRTADKRNRVMRFIKTLAISSAIGLAMCRFAVAQVQDSHPSHVGAAHEHMDPAALVEHLSKFFPSIAAFDTNKDGKLDATEKQALAKAIADGKLELPAHTPPHGEKPTPEMMVNHIVDMYARVAVYDVNHDGQLDAAEQATLKAAIEKGEFSLHDPHSQHDHGAGS